MIPREDICQKAREDIEILDVVRGWLGSAHDSINRPLEAIVEIDYASRAIPVLLPKLLADRAMVTLGIARRTLTRSPAVCMAALDVLRYELTIYRNFLAQSEALVAC